MTRPALNPARELQRAIELYDESPRHGREHTGPTTSTPVIAIHQMWGQLTPYPMFRSISILLSALVTRDRGGIQQPSERDSQKRKHGDEPYDPAAWLE